MNSLKQIIKHWNYERQILSSRPIRDRKTFASIKQLLTRCWITADYEESRGIIRISLNPDEPQGQSNIQKFGKMQIKF